MRNKLKKAFPFFVLLCAVLFSAAPLFMPGFIPTHDGEYHLIRFYEFENMLRAGHWFPRWAAGLNSGYGIPLFNFFYPFPNYIGALFHGLGWSLADSFKLTLAMGYLLAVLFYYLWLVKLFNRTAALVGSVVFALTPYWFVDLYVRGSVGEVIAIGWFMVALTSVERRWPILISISTAGIILSHNIMSMLFIPLVIGYGIVRNRAITQWIVFGVALSAYFWLPALLERQYVIGLNVVNFRDHFPELFQLLIPSWGTGFSAAGVANGEMSQQLGVTTILVVIWTVLRLFREKEKGVRRLIGISLILFILLIFFMLSFSQLLWEAITPLQLLQYPWRLLSVVIPLGGLFGAYVASTLKRSVWSVIIVLAAVILALGYVRPVTYEPRGDAYYLSRREFTDGTSSLGNSFSTKWSSWKPQRAAKRVEILTGAGVINGVGEKDPVDLRFDVILEKEAIVRMNTTYYPGWTVEVDGKTTVIDFTKDGTITFMAPSGTHAVRVHFGETPLRKTADIISLASLLWIVLSAILGVKHAYRHRHNPP